jgi:hypothetical protein
MDKMQLTDIYRVFRPKATEYTFFSAVHGTSCKINPILGHKANLNKYKKIEIIHCILRDHNGIKLEINGKENCKNHSHSWRLNNTLLNNQ